MIACRCKKRDAKRANKRVLPSNLLFSPPRKRDFESETYGVSKSLIFIAPFSRLRRYISYLSGFVPREALVWLYKRTTDKASCFFGSNGLGAKKEAIGLCAKVDFKFQNRTASSSHKWYRHPHNLRKLNYRTFCVACPVCREHSAFPNVQQTYGSPFHHQILMTSSTKMTTIVNQFWFLSTWPYDSSSHDAFLW